MSKDFMARRHEAFTVSEEQVFELVRQTTKKTPIKRTKSVLGFDNEVYRIETAENESFFVRIHRFGEVKPTEEIWAMEQSRKAGAPVPEVFFVGAIDLANSKYEAMVLSVIEGKPLADIRCAYSDNQLDQALIDAGRVLRKIHSVKAGGFYHRQIDGKWDFSTWERFGASVIERRSKEKDLILSVSFSDNDFNFMLRMISLYVKEFPCLQPVLNHGDYLPEHIFIANDLQVTGIIDFGMFQGAPPIHDFAYFSFQAPRFNLNALIKGYGDHEMFHDRFELRLNLHKLSLQMGHLAYESKQNNTKAAEFHSEGLKKTLQKLRKLDAGS